MLACESAWRGRNRAESGQLLRRLLQPSSEDHGVGGLG